MAESFDAVVIGSGFGGAVTACRLVEAGFSICVLERGRRYGPDDFPVYPGDDIFVHEDTPHQNTTPPPDFSRWLWSRDHGLYDIQDLGDAVVVQASGYGGGSLVYTNVHLRPPSDLFEHGWPAPYAPEPNGDWGLARFFDLAAYMLRARPMRRQLAKTVQLQRAAAGLGGGAHVGTWFRLPLAVSFEEDAGDAPNHGDEDETFTNAFGRQQRHCDMRGRCWLGCDRQAKNTLDLNYLARAEDDPTHAADVRTMAEVTTIERTSGGRFRVTYTDLLARVPPGDQATHHIDATHVFLCAGALGTTRLLFENRERLTDSAGDGPLGSHFFTNSGSLAAVFDCDQPHDAHFGPTITSAVLCQGAADERYGRSVDFTGGASYTASAPPTEGMRVAGETSGASAVLAHDPLLDWGSWEAGTAVGALVLTETNGDFQAGERLLIGGGAARARARSRLRDRRHWFIAQDGGYPSDIEPLVGLFRSPLWARRNRFLEVEAGPAPSMPPGRQLRVNAFADVMTGVPTADLLETEVRDLLPRWLVTSLDAGRQELVTQAAAAFLPMLGRLLDELSVTLADQASADLITRLNVDVVGGPRKEVLVRGMLRQALQVLAGSEVTLAHKAAEVFTRDLPLSPEQLLRAAGSVALWALAYGSVDRHTALLLTMGRDPYRGRLEFTRQATGTGVIRARLPAALERPSALFQERVLRTIARDGWRGELRTSPAWVPLETHLTVHSQGGCPMGTDPDFSVTDPWGQVHGCPGLYVMDAAAFPTSVGVNPSATIAAVAEMKIEHFIREHRHASWETPDKQLAVAWVDTEGRRHLDPLGGLAARAPASSPGTALLGLRFRERMRGFLAAADGAATAWDRLPELPRIRERFSLAEDEGMRRGWTIAACLRASVDDLGALVASERSQEPMKVRLTGRVVLQRRGDNAPIMLRADGVRSYLQFFLTVTPPAVDGPAVRFFRYELHLTGRSHACTLRGVKILSNERGSDLWSDTSTLFFELDGSMGLHRGILRLSLADFARRQLRSFVITGTTDATRQSWALAAFAKYFVRGLSEVYMARADRVLELLLKSVTTIHV